MKKQQGLIALLLCIMVLIGFIPRKASAATEISYDAVIELERNEIETNWAEIKAAFEEAKQFQRIQVTVTGRARLPEPLVNRNGASFYITGQGNDASLLVENGAEETFAGQYLLSFSGGARAAHLDIQNLTMDGRNICGLVFVQDYGTVHFGNSADNTNGPVRFQSGKTSSRQNGSVCLL